MAIIDADGQKLGVYRKSHIPDGPGYLEKFYFSPGNSGFKVWDTRFGKIGAGICWDQWFPEAARLTSLLGAEILFYPTAIGWHPKEKKKFGYKWKGQSAIIGKHYGIAESMGIKITGFWAWVLWRNYYLNKMPNIEKRIRVWLDWNIDLFSRIDISRYGFKRDTSKEYRELDEVDDVW